MSQARDLLSSLVSSTAPSATARPNLLSTLPNQSTEPVVAPGLLSASIITPSPNILSVQAFDAQLATGGKDSALRKAADVLRVAADGVERSAIRSERYWVEALRLRKSNWGLVTAPLPIGAPTGKGADKASKDFLVCYGLESCAFNFN
jgi:mediator of RNA polymerase II transcription subunit 17, fungi type